MGNCFVITHDVVIYVADGDPVETLIGVFECSEHSFVKRAGSDVDFDVPCVDVLGPVDIQYLVFSSEAFALGHICTGKYVGIRWGCMGGVGCRCLHFERGKQQVLGACLSGLFLFPSLVEFQQFLVTIIAPVRILTPFIRFGVLVVFL